jgi:helix-turn-helix protein
VGQAPFGTEQDVSNDFIPIEEAARRSGLHSNTIKRLLRSGQLRGHKTNLSGRRCWMVSVYSLRHYTDPINGFLLDMPGPKLFLSKLHEEHEAGQD